RPLTRGPICGHRKVATWPAAKGRTVRHRAVGAGVDGAHGERDHLAFGPGEPRWPLHERLVELEEGPEMVWLPRVVSEHVRDEAGFLRGAVEKVLGKVGGVGDG